MVVSALPQISLGHSLLNDDVFVPELGRIEKVEALTALEKVFTITLPG